MKQNIIAIGGGDFKKYQTLAIDKEIIASTNKQHPHFLFIPTASSDDENYTKTITAHYKDLGCTTTTLYLLKENPSYQEIKDKILSADIIYVGGGNTLKMMRLWRKLSVDKLLNAARQKGTVLCGVSAGSICWFNFGNSDSRKFKNPNADYIKVTALGFINAFHCPHYDTEPARKASLKKMLHKYPGVAIALDDCAALQVRNNTYRIITSNKNAKAYKIYWKKNIFYEEIITINTIFTNIAHLLNK